MPRKVSRWVCRIELCVPGRVRAEKPAWAGRWDQPFGKTRVGSCRAQDGDAVPALLAGLGGAEQGLGSWDRPSMSPPAPAAGPLCHVPVQGRARALLLPQGCPFPRQTGARSQQGGACGDLQLPQCVLLCPGVGRKGLPMEPGPCCAGDGL